MRGGREGKKEAGKGQRTGGMGTGVGRDGGTGGRRDGRRMGGMDRWKWGREGGRKEMKGGRTARRNGGTDVKDKGTGDGDAGCREGRAAGSREGKGRRVGGEDGEQKGWKERKRRKKGWMEGTKGRTEGSGQGTDGRDGRAGGGQGQRALGAVEAAGRSQGSSRTEQEHLQHLQHLQHHRGPGRCQRHAHATRPWPPGHGGSAASTHGHCVLALPEVPRGLRPPAQRWPRHTSRPSPCRCHHGGRHHGGCHGQHQGQRHRVLHHGQRPQWPRRVALVATAGDPVGHAMARHGQNPPPCPGDRPRGCGSSDVSRPWWRVAARSTASPEGAAAPTLMGTPAAHGSGATVPGHGS